jgi:hypothetical protein
MLNFLGFLINVIMLAAALVTAWLAWRKERDTALKELYDAVPRIRAFVVRVARWMVLASANALLLLGLPTFVMGAVWPEQTDSAILANFLALSSASAIMGWMLLRSDLVDRRNASPGNRIIYGFFGIVLGIMGLISLLVSLWAAVPLLFARS